MCSRSHKRHSGFKNGKASATSGMDIVERWNLRIVFRFRAAGSSRARSRQRMGEVVLHVHCRSFLHSVAFPFHSFVTTLQVHRRRACRGPVRQSVHGAGGRCEMPQAPLQSLPNLYHRARQSRTTGCIFGGPDHAIASDVFRHACCL